MKNLKTETYKGIKIYFKKYPKSLNVDAYFDGSPIVPAAMGCGKVETFNNAKIAIDKYSKSIKFYKSKSKKDKESDRRNFEYLKEVSQ